MSLSPNFHPSLRVRDLFLRVVHDSLIVEFGLMTIDSSDVIRLEFIGSLLSYSLLFCMLGDSCLQVPLFVFLRCLSLFCSLTSNLLSSNCPVFCPSRRHCFDRNVWFCTLYELFFLVCQFGWLAIGCCPSVPQNVVSCSSVLLEHLVRLSTGL